MQPLKRQRKLFLYRSAQAKALLKAKHVWYVVRREEVAGSSVLHQDGTGRTATTTGVVMDDEYVQGAVCSLIPQQLGTVPYPFVMAHKHDLRGTWEILQQQYRGNTTFNKPVLHSSLSQM